MSSQVENRVQYSTDRSKAAKAELSELLQLAGMAQKDATKAVTAAHIAAGESAVAYLGAAMAGITADQAKACLAFVDQLIDASQDGRERNARRQEIREQVIAAHLVGLIPLVADLPWGHVRAVLQCKVCVFNQTLGTAEIARQEWMQAIRAIVGDAVRNPVSRENLREQLAGVTGKETSASRKAADARKAAVVEQLRQQLGNMTDEQRAAVIAAHPELSSEYVDETAVLKAVQSVNVIRGTASFPAVIVRLLETSPVDIVGLIFAKLPVELIDGIMAAMSASDADSAVTE